MLKLLEICFAVKVEHEAGYICAMLFIIPGFPFITSGIDLANWICSSGMERMMYSVIIISVAMYDSLGFGDGTGVKTAVIYYDEPWTLAVGCVAYLRKLWRCIRIFCYVQQSDGNLLLRLE